jgi:hypothetical protein
MGNTYVTSAPKSGINNNTALNMANNIVTDIKNPSSTLGAAIASVCVTPGQLTTAVNGINTQLTTMQGRIDSLMTSVGSLTQGTGKFTPTVNGSSSGNITSGVTATFLRTGSSLFIWGSVISATGFTDDNIVVSIMKTSLTQEITTSTISSPNINISQIGYNGNSSFGIGLLNTNFITTSSTIGTPFISFTVQSFGSGPYSFSYFITANLN